MIKDSWKLVHDDGRAAVIGETITDFRGDTATLDGGRPPHKPGSTGRVWVKLAGMDCQSELFPNVFNLKWIRIYELTCICREVLSDAPPEYPDPLIYTIKTCNLDQAEITKLCVTQRELDVEFNFELEVLFVFDGDISPALDWRE